MPIGKYMTQNNAKKVAAAAAVIPANTDNVKADAPKVATVTGKMLSDARAIVKVDYGRVGLELKELSGRAKTFALTIDTFQNADEMVKYIGIMDVKVSGLADGFLYQVKGIEADKKAYTLNILRAMIVQGGGIETFRLTAREYAALKQFQDVDGRASLPDRIQAMINAGKKLNRAFLTLKELCAKNGHKFTELPVSAA
jgi:hypothetical protein